MADEFAGLSGAVCVDENEIRAEVEVAVAAQASQAAIEDELKVKAAWKAMQAAEEEVSSLQQALLDAERQHATAAAGLMTVLHGQRNRHTTSGESAETPTALSTLQVKLRRATQAVEERGGELRALKLSVAQRKMQRLEEARRSASSNGNAHPLPQGRSASHGSTTAGPAGPIQRKHPAPTPVGRTPLSMRVKAAAAAGAGPTPPPARRQPGWQYDDQRAGMAESYSGGTVLPALCRVRVTRADVQAKRNCYVDDTDIEAYHARQQKRRRLEAADALLRAQQDSGLTVATLSQLPLGTRRVKLEVTSSDGANAVEKNPSDERGGEAPGEVEQLPAAPVHEVIDVDALMEGEEDVSSALLQRILTTAITTSNNSNVASARGLHKDEEDDAAVHVPPEAEVTLLPGIRIGQSVYSRLVDYQQEGLRWLLQLHTERTGGILGDEMGLGKTVQIAALLNALSRSHQLRGPALIVAPVTVLRQWVAELHRWAPYMRVCVMHESMYSGGGGGKSSAASRETLMRAVFGTPAVVLTTYAALRLHCTLLHTGGFQYVILDEGHKISNPEAGVTLAAKSFLTPHRIILSGSPIQNSLKELWCLFDFVRPGLLGTLAKFIDEFETPITQSRNVRATPLALATAVACARTLQAQVAPYLLRRLKRHVHISLPRKFERVIRVPLGDEQLEQYVEILSSPAVQRLFREALHFPQISGGLDRDGRDASGSLHVAGRHFNLAVGNKKNAGLRLESFRVMNQLRQVSNHADIYKVLKGSEEDERNRMLSLPSPRSGGGGGGAYVSRSFRSNNVVNIEGGSKLKVLLQMLREWRRHGHRALVFSQTRMMLDIIENLCEQENFRYTRMDGTTNTSHRQELMDRFNEDDEILVALLTTRVGGIGVNLIGADRVVIFDPDWNPTTDIQARERAWRIGQTHDVCVYRLITSGTVEEVILLRQLAKTYVTEKVLKDPTLQRFFSGSDSFVESLFLGAEYDARVPRGKKHVMAAQEAAPREETFTDEAEGGQPPALLGDEVNKCDSDDGGSPVGVPGETEFGVLLSVTTGDADGAATGAVKEEEGRPAAAQPPTRGANNVAETDLLRSLVDGQEVMVSGNDGVAHRLAQAKAQQTMLRVTNHTTRTLLEQQKEFSLMWAAEQKKIREEADREEQGRYYAEEQAALRRRGR